MSKANSYPIPSTKLDKEIANLALGTAQKLVKQGVKPEEAATVACHGAWSKWRRYVLAALRDRSGVASIEFAILACFLTIAGFGIGSLIGPALDNYLTGITASIASAKALLATLTACP